jgi:hypothetical protein
VEAVTAPASGVIDSVETLTRCQDITGWPIAQIRREDWSDIVVACDPNLAPVEEC